MNLDDVDLTVCEVPEDAETVAESEIVEPAAAAASEATTERVNLFVQLEPYCFTARSPLKRPHQ